MKKIKIVLYTLMVLLVFSCSTNEEIFEVESVKVENEIQTSARKEVPYKNNTFKYTMTRVYKNAYTDAQKANIRALFAVDYISFSWEACPDNTYIEFWTVTTMIQPPQTTLLNDKGNEDDVGIIYKTKLKCKPRLMYY
jgi:hypothetical protein